MCVVVYDVTDREVRRLVDGRQAAGYYRVVWDERTEDGAPAATGVYLCRLETEKVTATRHARSCL